MTMENPSSSPFTVKAIFNNGQGSSLQRVAVAEAPPSAQQPVNPSTPESENKAITMETRHTPPESKSDLGADSGISLLSGLVIAVAIAGLGAWLLFKKKKRAPANSAAIESAYSSKDRTMLNLASQLTEIFKKI